MRGAQARAACACAPSAASDESMRQTWLSSPAAIPSVQICVLLLTTWFGTCMAPVTAQTTVRLTSSTGGGGGLSTRSWERRLQGGTIPPECPAACQSCQRDPVDFPITCTACCSTSNWCGAGAAWCNTGVDCAVCQPAEETPGDEALSLGWAIIISSLVVAAVYVGGGIYKGRHENPDAPLVDAHPHAAAWKTVPGLVSDGVHWTKITLGIGSTGSSHAQDGDYDDLDVVAHEKDQLLDDRRRRSKESKERKNRSRRRESDAVNRGTRKKSRERSHRNTVAESKPKPQPQPLPKVETFEWTVKDRASVGERVQDLEVAVAVTSGAKE